MSSSLPLPVGPSSERVIHALARGRRIVGTPLSDADDPLEHDLQLALFVLNELHFGGWHRVDEAREWDPGVTSARTAMADEFERRLRARLLATPAEPLQEARRLLGLDGPSVSAFLRDHGNVDQVAETMILRSPYQSKEADPHTFAVPRFSGTAKRVFTDIQSGEYGVGPRYSHAELFAGALEALGLDPAPNAHLDRCTGPALATSNLVTVSAMQRRLRGAVLGQLSLFEMDSVVPNQAMTDACDRLGLDGVRPFFHIHVLADTEHEVMVADEFLTRYPADEPEQVANVLFGMRAQSLVDRALAADSVPAWEQARSALAGSDTAVTTAVA